MGSIVDNVHLAPYNVRMALKQKTVYFREEDLPKWEAISNKAEWLHEHLNTKEPVVNFIQHEPDSLDRDLARSMEIKNISTLCDHFQIKGNCEIKGCKYGRGAK